MNFKRTIFAIVVVMGLLIVIPFMIPTDTYIRQIEQGVSEKLGVPVKVRGLHLALLPSPRANIRDVVIGRDAEIQIERISAVLDMSTLFDHVKVISRLEFRRPVVKQAALEILGALAGEENSPEAAASVAVRRIVLKKAQLEWEGLTLPLLDADVAMSEDGRLQQAAIASEDNKLSIKASPKGAGYAARLQAQQWTPPAGPALLFDTLVADIDYAGQAVEVNNIDATLYRGRLQGSARLDWSKGWRLAGKIKTDAIELGDASKLFTRTVKVSGRVSGSGTFSSSAKEAGQLRDQLVLDYKFNVADGVLYGMDLIKAATLLVRQGETGGETRFDVLSGTLHTSGKQIDLRQLRATSGLLAAQGNVRITPERKLAGKVDAELKQGVALVTVPLEISGTLDQPLVMPTKAALAGAIAGTAVLGPLGTSLGAKAGSALDKLFGGN